MRTGVFVGLACVLTGLAAGVGCSDDAGSPTDACAVGSERCACTTGGACDPGLTCLSDVCVAPNDGGGSGASGDDGGSRGPSGSGSGSAGTGGGGAGNPATDGDASTMDGGGTSSGSDGGDAGDATDGGSSTCSGGCRAIDVLFALDGSGSLTEEIQALADSEAFEDILQAIEGVGCGGVSYRIGVTDDDDGAWYGSGADTWFDSDGMTRTEVASAFADAAADVITGGGTSPGCEHVLSSAADLLVSDTSGFLRSNALLVLVLLTDVDDYGAYDQQGGNTCGVGCTTSGAAVSQIRDDLLALKGDDPKQLATIVVAGDPTVAAGVDFCGRQGSCGCSGSDCAVFHADRLHDWVGMMAGDGGSFADLCTGAASVPAAIQSAVEASLGPTCNAL